MIEKKVLIKAKTETEAQQIASAMSAMSGNFTAKEWQGIAKKLSSKIVQMRIRLMIQL